MQFADARAPCYDDACASAAAAARSLKSFKAISFTMLTYCSLSLHCVAAARIERAC